MIEAIVGEILNVLVTITGIVIVAFGTAMAMYGLWLLLGLVFA